MPTEMAETEKAVVERNMAYEIRKTFILID